MVTVSGKPRFNRNRRYVNFRGQKFGKGVWYDEKGKMIKPGQGVYDGSVVKQYNTDGTITTFSRRGWAEKKQVDQEVRVMQRDRKWAIPFIPKKRMTIHIDKNANGFLWFKVGSSVILANASVIH